MHIAGNYRNLWDAGLALGRFGDTGQRLAGVVIVTRPAYEPASRLVESTPETANIASVFTLAPCKNCPAGRLQ